MTNQNPMIPALRAIASLTLLSALVACGSSAPVQYSSLEALETGYARDTDDYESIGIGPLRTPDYLARPRIVTRGNNAEIIIDDFNRWAEPVDDAVHRIVAANVDALLDGVVAVAFPYSHIRDLDYRIVGRVDRFDADQGGRVVLSVQWTIVGPDADFVSQPRRARYEARASSADDYSAIAKAMTMPGTIA